MNALKRLLFGVLVLISLSPLVVFAAICDVSVTPIVVDVDNDYSANAGRITVFGEGTGIGFSENTKVEVNCNVDGTLPGANQDVVNARISAYTPTVLSYTGAYCSYKPSSKDIDYKVSATIKLEDTVCSGGYCFGKMFCNKGTSDYAIVTVKASSKAVVTPAPTEQQCGGLNQTPCTTCPAEKKCNARGCLEPYVGYIKSGLCVSCPSGSTYDGFGSCINCGAEGRPACSVPLPNGKTCETGLTVDSQGKCVKQTQKQCGNANQKPCGVCQAGMICSGGCNEPYVNINGQCLSCESGYVYSGGGGRVPRCLRCGGELLYACGAPAPNGKICDAGLVVLPGDGICVKQKTVDKGNGDLTGTEKELRFALDWKWNLIGVPYGEITSEDHSCISKLYYYDKDNGKYKKVANLTDKNLIGKGLWAKRARSKSESGDCIIKYNGRFLSSQTIDLKKGWNLISVQTENGINTTKPTNCKIIGGPFTYSGFIENGKPQGYYKRDNLNSGSGYWIKVADACKISSEEEEEAPPAPPELNTQTVEPQGVRGRRFVEDAG